MRNGYLPVLALVAVFAGASLAGAQTTMPVGEITLAAEPPAAAGPVSMPTSACTYACNDCCTDSPCFWASGEYLLWWIKDAPLPVPMVSTNPTLDNGAITDPGTSVLLGGENLKNEARSGGRFRVGLSLDREATWGIEGSYFFLGNRSIRRSLASDGSGFPQLTIPFFNPGPVSDNNRPVPGEDLTFISIPGVVAGGFALDIASRMQGAEAIATYKFSPGEALRLSLLGGFRYLELAEDLTFTTVFSQAPAGSTAVGGTIDQIDTRNNFYGGQVGAALEYTRGRWSVQTAGKLALGTMHETVNYSGLLQASPGNFFFSGVTASNTGYFVTRSNSGRHGRDVFAVAPQLDVAVSFEATRWARLSVGYSFLYLSDVLRPGNQIDRNINPTQAAGFSTGLAPFGPAQPVPLLNRSDFWAQGISFKVEFRY